MGDAIPQDLGGGLSLKLAQTTADVERIARLHALAFEPAHYGATMTLESYPGMRREDFCFVQESATGKAVSSICLVPTTWVYEGVPLRVAELGIVATHPDYRQRGLIREQMRWFEGQLHARQFDLASIQGIPHFYRQFGFEYIIPMGGGYELRPDQIPGAEEGEEVATVREAGPGDVPLLQAYLAEAGAGLAVSLRREPAAWLYQDEPTRTDEEAFVTYLALEAGEPVGYFRLFRNETRSHSGVRLVEASPLPYRACLAALRLTKELAPRRQHAQTVRIALPPGSPLAKVAAGLGGRWLRPYGWLVRVHDAVHFLTRIGPALERRLAGSFLAGYSGALQLNLYSDSIELAFREGRLERVRRLAGRQGQAGLPWWAAWQLWLGHRSLEELTAWYPDAWAEGACRPLIDVLFPKRESWVFPTL
jgi:predicted N-acetyltransferase YhbS